MQGLDSWQRSFIAAIRESRSIPGLKEEPIPASVATSIYRNNIFGNMTDSLANIYTSVEKLLGKEFFVQAARTFIDATPVQSGDMNDYGASFADSLEVMPALADLPYIADMARLEWLCHLAYGAPDAKSMVVMPGPQEIDRHHYVLHPAAHLMQSRYPLKAIWDLCAGDDGEVSLDAGPCFLLIHRIENEVVLVPLSATVYAFAQSLGAGDTQTAVMTKRDAPEDADCERLFQWGVFVANGQEAL